MTKSIKRFTASFLAAMLVLTTLCTTAFAAGTIKATVSGEIGNKKISYSYSVDSKLTTARIGFYTTPTESTYLLTFSPASGSGATIYFNDFFTGEELAKLTVPQSGGGMPGSFITSVNLGKYKFVDVSIKSNSSSTAKGWFTIEGVFYEDDHN